MESPSRVLLGSQSEEFGWFLSTSTSSTPIRVDTGKVGHIHVLLPTLEYSAPMSSPAVPGLTECHPRVVVLATVPREGHGDDPGHLSLLLTLLSNQQFC